MLVLDGVETLQHPPDQQRGELKELRKQEGLKTFIKTVCQNELPAGGLVVITSKQRIRELDGYWGNCEIIDIEGLQPPDGAKLLRDHGVVGDQIDMEEASREQRGNPFCLLLLEAFLRRRDTRSILERGPFVIPQHGEYAEWVKAAIAAYADHLNESEKQFLRLLGLFGRAMKKKEIDELRERKAKAVDFLGPDPKKGIDETLVAHLCDLHLLNAPESGPRETWDTHPLVRQHFAEEFRNQHRDMWHEAHRILFEYYRDTAPKDPTDPYELLPLFGAVRHGCLAGQYSEALKLYRDKIAKDFMGFDTEVAGFASESQLALSGFFDKNNVAQLNDLNEYQQAWVLERYSYCLHSLGELKSAIFPRQESNRLYQKLYVSEHAKVRYETARDGAHGGEILSLIEGRLGRLLEARTSADEAVSQALLSEQDEPGAKLDPKWTEDYCQPGSPPPVPGWVRVCSTKSALGRVSHLQGRLIEAAGIFDEAASIIPGTVRPTATTAIAITTIIVRCIPSRGFAPVCSGWTW